MSLESTEEQIKDIQERQAKYLESVKGNKEEEDKINQWAAEEIAKINKEEQEKMYDTLINIAGDLKEAVVTDTGNWIADGIGNITKSLFSGVETMMEAISQMGENVTENIKIMAQAVGSVISDMYNAISEVQMDAMEAELEAMQEADAEKLEELQVSKEDQLTAIQEDYDAQLEALQAKLDRGEITEAQFAEQKAVLDKSKADKETATVKAMEDKIAEQKKENRKKENEQKKKIFEAQKANQIANIWIQTAIGVVSAFAGACQWPGVSMIAGLIFAGIMSGILIASAIAQTVVIGQQSYVPEMALGGSLAAGETAIINERGTEMITPGVSSYITPASITSSILENVGKSQGKQQNISVSFDGANISNQMELEDVTDYVIMRLGQKLETA
jgi:hypothetical protein